MTIKPPNQPSRLAGVTIAAIDVEIVDKLNPKHRQILEMAGKTYEQVAAELGIPVGTVRSRLNRARRALIKLREEHINGLLRDQIIEEAVEELVEAGLAKKVGDKYAAT